MWLQGAFCQPASTPREGAAAAARLPLQGPAAGTLLMRGGPHRPPSKRSAQSSTCRCARTSQRAPPSAPPPAGPGAPSLADGGGACGLAAPFAAAWPPAGVRMRRASPQRLNRPKARPLLPGEFAAACKPTGSGKAGSVTHGRLSKSGGRQVGGAKSSSSGRRAEFSQRNSAQQLSRIGACAPQLLAGA